MISIESAVIRKVRNFGAVASSVLLIVLMTFSLYSTYLEIQSLAYLVRTNIIQEVTIFDESGELYALQRRLSSIFQTIEKTTQAKLRVQIYADSQLIADFGKDNPFWTISYEIGNISKSGRNLSINYSIQILSILIKHILLVISLISCVVVVLIIQKILITKHLKFVINPINQLTENISNLELDMKPSPIFKKVIFETQPLKEVSLLESTLRDLLQSRENYENVIKDLHIEIGEKRVAKQVAHDIRSPITAIEAVIGNLSQSERERFKILLIAGNRIKSISEDLLEKSKSQRNTLDLTRTSRSFNLYLASKEILEENAVTSNDIFTDISGLNVIKDYDVIGVKSEYQRILMNLLNNSKEAKHSLRNLTIKFECKIQLLEKKLHLSIEDNGKGIPKAIIGLIGTEGFSHDKNHEKISGTGIGIHSAKEKIKKWGAELHIDSKEGAWTKITIIFLLA